MLRVVQTAAWDWEPPHMSGYPHLPPPPPTAVPAASCQPSTPAVVPPRPAVAPLSAAAAPPPPRLRRMARRRGAPRLPCPMARPALQRASRPSFNQRRCSARSPMWHKSRRCVGGCGTNLIVRPPLQLPMCGLYGAVSHMYVEPRSRLPNVLQLGGPRCVFTASAGDGRDAGQSAPEHKSRRI